MIHSKTFCWTWLAWICLAAVSSASAGAVVLENAHLRLEIGEDGMLRSLADKAGGVDYSAGEPSPIAVVYRGGRSVCDAEGPYAEIVGRWVYRGPQFPATGVSLHDGKLVIDFASARVKATYRVHSTGDYLALELLDLEGEAIDRIDLVRLNVRKLPHVGQWLNAVYDDRFGICLRGGNLETNAEMWPGDGDVLLTATAEASVGFRGATAVIIGCPEPRKRLLDAMAAMERGFHLPSGATFRRSPLQKCSYFWASRATPANIGQFIEFAKRGGFRVLLFSYTSFAKAPGHFSWNDDYPRGMADLRQVADAVRQAGLGAGLHIHYSKAGKSDPYVTPVPDDRLHTVASYTLAADAPAGAATLTVRENPAGATLDDGRRILKLGKELIEYEAYRTDEPFQFTGCRRGSLGTAAAAHRAGDRAGLLDVDTWPAFIRFDQDTDIQDEVARQIADIYRRTGPYEMVYFDGAEDVHEPYWYNVARAQHRVFRLLEPPPPVCESANYTHFSWHMISRSNAYDVVAAPEGMKDFCRLMPCPTAAARVWDFSRVQFGWLGRFGAAPPGSPGPDVFEYVASRAAAWDCPLSLHAGLQELHANPRADDCLDAIKTWEDARLSGQWPIEGHEQLKNVAPADAHYVPCYRQREVFKNILANQGLTDAQRRILKDRREHHLFLNEQGDYELVEIEEAAGVAQGAVKAYVFRRARKPADAYALLWAVAGQARLRLPVDSGAIGVFRPFATSQPLQSEDGRPLVPIGPRTYLAVRGAGTDDVRKMLAGAEVLP
ncbi:MAG: hypothetical protein ACOX1P_13380 [Thermoguttaceae bacterium]